LEGHVVVGELFVDIKEERVDVSVAEVRADGGAEGGRNFVEEFEEL